MLEFIVSIVDSSDREWILQSTANEHSAAAREAVAELAERLSGFEELTIPKPGSTIKVAPAGVLVTYPTEVFPPEWEAWKHDHNP
jgi:hypothetical protein